MVDAVHVEVAWDTDPLTRPAEEDWTRLATVDPKILLESLSTSRGVNIRTGDIETGEATAKLSDVNGNLDPSNAAGEWFPNAFVRRRCRFVIDPAPDLLTWGGDLLTWDGVPLALDAGETVLWTGFVRRLPTQWRREVQWTTLSAAGIFWLLAETALPGSVLYVETMALEPDAYWPFGESQGLLVEDAAGTSDGHLSKESENRDIIPHATGGTVLTNASMGATLIPVGENFTFAGWFQTTTEATVWKHYGPGGEYVRLRVTADGAVLEAFDGATTDTDTKPATGLLDGRTHHIVISTALVSSVVMLVRVYVDGQALLEEPVAGVLDQGFTLNVDGEACVAALRWVTIGDRTAALTVAHAAWWNSSEPGVAEILWEAGTSAWDGDLTGARLNRILDLVGVDADDRDIDTGTQTCGPTALNGENVMDYIRQIAATEGGPVGETADGKVFLRNRVGNAPAPIVVFTDDPDGDGGYPVGPLDPDYSLDRVINIARVTRENGVPQESTAPASVTTYGPKTVELATLHQAASGARASASRLTIRNADPRLVFPSIVADSIDVPSEILTGGDIGDATVVIGRPPRGGDPISQTSLVERVEHDLAARGLWVTTFGVVEHTALPEFWWDEPGQGWDESVWAS